MFSRLFRNIAITGMAYGVISGIGLLLAPFMISTYGLAGYGQILLARIFLPNAVFGLFDLGLGETTTRSVAHARTSEDWHGCAATLTLLIIFALTMSVVIGGGMIVLSGYLPDWLKIASPQQAGFSQILILTAVLQPLLFLSLISEGALKGLERFELLRTCEIVSAVTQGASAIFLGMQGYGPNWIAASFLASLVLRFGLVTWAALANLRGHGIALRRWSPAIWDEVWKWTRLMIGNKALGTLQYQIASPLIGFVLGPSAVGAYDTAVRLPRFAKTAFGLVSATVLPMAATLRASNRRRETTRLGYYGILGSYAVTAPLAIFAGLFSELILSLWIGPEVSRNWPWQSAMFIVALANVPISFGGAILLADRDASKSMMKLTTIQIVLQLMLSFALLGFMRQWAFVIAQTIAVLLTFFAQLALLRQKLELPRRLNRNLLRVTALSTGVSYLALVIARPSGPFTLGMTFIAAMGVIALCMPWLLLNREERAAGRGFLRKRRRMKAVDA